MHRLMRRRLDELSPHEVRRLARLGDAIVNFAISAVLTLKYSTPRGVKVPDKLLREAARGLLTARRGLGLEDIFEAAVGLAWLSGVSADEMVRAALKAAEGGEDEGEAVSLALRGLLEYAVRRLG